MNQNWKNNPRLQAIDPKKLEIMEFLVVQCQGKSLEMILPDLMATFPAVYQNKDFPLPMQKPQSS